MAVGGLFRMAKVELRRIGVVSAGKIVGLMYGVFGIIAALFFVVYMLVISLLGVALSRSLLALFPAVFGVAFIFLLPVMYGLMGFVLGCLGALIYNFIAGKIGGLELETA